VPRTHALIRAEITTSLDELVPVALTFVDRAGEQELRLWLSHLSSFPLTSDGGEVIQLGDRSRIFGQLASISFRDVYYRQYLFDGCGLGLGLLARNADDESADLDWMTLRALAIVTATDICPRSDGPQPALSMQPGLYVLDGERVGGARWLFEAPPELLYPSSDEHDLRLQDAELRFARPTVDHSLISIREAEMRWRGLGTRQGFTIVARAEVQELSGAGITLPDGTVGVLERSEREERHRGIAPRLVSLHGLAFSACGWTYRIDVEADDIGDSELTDVAASIVRACKGADRAG
jgi:hypothetical protein